MDIGINRAKPINKSFNERYYVRTKPCVFLSHRSLDKNMVRQIGEYITKAGIDIYLDENDNFLQNAAQSGNDEATVSCIQKGLMESTHVLCILSKTTVDSWWVPYEIGYGEKGEIEIASLKIANLRKEEIPSYLRIRECLIGIKDLNNYILKIADKKGIKIEQMSKSQHNEYKIKRSASILQESYTNHPLKGYLDQ